VRISRENGEGASYILRPSGTGTRNNKQTTNSRVTCDESRSPVVADASSDLYSSTCLPSISSTRPFRSSNFLPSRNLYVYHYRLIEKSSLLVTRPRPNPSLHSEPCFCPHFISHFHHNSNIVSQCTIEPSGQYYLSTLLWSWMFDGLSGYSSRSTSGFHHMSSQVRRRDAGIPGQQSVLQITPEPAYH
jgi:hypothetical protein